MISKHLEAKIKRLHYSDLLPCGTIARNLGLHHSTVERVLREAGAADSLRPPRPRKIDPYTGFIVEKLKDHPDLRASRLYAMVKERGYDGQPDHFRSLVAGLRPRRPSEAYLRLRTLPGEQAQVDWGHFGSVLIGRAVRKLYAFVLVLAWSRWIFLRFGYDIGMAGFVRGHVEAFEFFGGVPRVLLYDNLKSAVLERMGDAVHFNPALLELSGHYRYEPRPVAVARGNEKGRVERAIRYIRDNFFAGRQFTDLDDLNAQADAWCRGAAADRRCPEDTTLTVKAAFELEKPQLAALPANPFPVEERKEVVVGKTPYIRFDLNDYSVPHDLTRRTVTVLATTSQVRVLDGMTVVATHARTYDKGKQVENPEHLQRLVEQKQGARLHRSQDRVLTAVPKSAELLNHLAERGGNLGSAVSALGRLLDHYGAADVDRAVAEALAQDVPHVGAVRQILERRQHERGLPPPIAVMLPADKPELRDLHVRPHDLARYDQLSLKKEANDERQDSK